jgi:hypothetical protein
MFGLLPALGAIEHFQFGFGHGPLGISFIAGDSGLRSFKKSVNETPKSES